MREFAVQFQMVCQVLDGLQKHVHVLASCHIRCRVLRVYRLRLVNTDRIHLSQVLKKFHGFLTMQYCERRALQAQTLWCPSFEFPHFRIRVVAFEVMTRQ